MNCSYLDNGIKIIYFYRPGNIISFSIGFEAGANSEENNNFGVAHMVEHMLFKGTKKRSEKEINIECDKIFGFNNAMTNYPYAIYYGTTLKEDFFKGIDIYSDLIINPIFEEKGLNEEIKIVKEEIVEWKQDINQYCEDALFYNGFKKSRIKNIIHGEVNHIEAINISELKTFHSTYYTPENCVISVVGSEEYVNVYKAIEENFGCWEKKEYNKSKIVYEKNIPGMILEKVLGINGCRIKYCFSLHNLNERQILALRIFNFHFGEGTSSVLYHRLRTLNSLVYDVSSVIKNEKGIKLLVISLATSKGSMNKAIYEITEAIEFVKQRDYCENNFTESSINNISKIIKLKQELLLEKSIILCNKLTTTDIMEDDYSKMFFDDSILNSINWRDIYQTVNLTFNHPTIQILTD